MHLRSYVSSAALAAGVPARYLYWSGRSGRRYLFTRADAEAMHLADFGDGVAIAVSDEAVIWSGDLAALAFAPDNAWQRRADIYVHLLAATPEARRAIADDLRPMAGEHRKLAA